MTKVYLFIMSVLIFGYDRLLILWIMRGSAFSNYDSVDPRTLFWKCFLCHSNPKFPLGSPRYIRFQPCS